jgi:acyl carrier protein
VTEADLLVVIKDLIVLMAKTADPTCDEASVRADVERRLVPEAPMAQLGWDSMQMTWLLVRIEERFDIDTSTLSLFEMFTVSDLLRSLVPLIGEKSA